MAAPQTLLSSPGPINTWIPDLEGSNRLVVSYSRNKDRFQLPRYSTLIKAKAMTGFYRYITPDNAVRVLTADGSEWEWVDGGDRPTGNTNNSEFTNQSFLCRRRDYPKMLGYLSKEQADMDWKSVMFAELATQAMTVRSKVAATVLSTSANFGYANTATALGGGLWGSSSLDNAYIQKGIQAAARQILLNTGSAVRYEDLMMVMNPATATALACAPEVKNALIQQPSAPDLQWAGGPAPDSKINAAFGLGPRLFGVGVAVEDASNVTSKKGATRAASFIFPDNTIALIARPGGVTGIEGAQSFSSLSLFVYQEMFTESYDDVRNKRWEFHVTDNFTCVMTAPATAVLITNVLS